MRTTFLVSLLALTIVASSCRGYTGDAGPAGADGANGVDGADGANGADGADGADGKSGVDGKTGLAFDYVRGINGVTIRDGMLIIRASLVVPQSILDLAPGAVAPVQKSHKSHKSHKSEEGVAPGGVQLVLAKPDANIRYFLVPLQKGVVKVTSAFPGKTPQAWNLPFDTAGHLAVVPLNSVTALLLDPAVIAQGALIELPKNESRILEFCGNSLCIGPETRVRW
jgi:Collagen triple helix repeat (20 copies)